MSAAARCDSCDQEGQAAGRQEPEQGHEPRNAYDCGSERIGLLLTFQPDFRRRPFNDLLPAGRRLEEQPAAKQMQVESKEAVGFFFVICSNRSFRWIWSVVVPDLAVKIDDDKVGENHEE